MRPGCAPTSRCCRTCPAADPEAGRGSVADARRTVAALVLLARTAGARRVARRAAADRLTRRRAPGTGRGRRGGTGTAYPGVLGTESERGCLGDLGRAAAGRTVDRRRGVLQGTGYRAGGTEALGPDLHGRLGHRQRYEVGRVVDLLVQGRSRCRTGLLDLHLEVEEEPDRLLLDPVEHLVEHVEAFALVFHQRVALGVRAQPDTPLEVVHLVEVLAPLAVDHGEEYLALQLAHRVR